MFISNCNMLQTENIKLFKIYLFNYILRLMVDHVEHKLLDFFEIVYFVRTVRENYYINEVMLQD